MRRFYRLALLKSNRGTRGILSAMNLGLLLEIPKVILKVGWIYWATYLGVRKVLLIQKDFAKALL